MKDAIKLIFWHGLLATLIYVGLFQGVTSVANILAFILGVICLLYVVFIVIFLLAFMMDVRTPIEQKKKPTPFQLNVALLLSTLLAIFMAAGGWVFPAIIYFILYSVLIFMVAVYSDIAPEAENGLD